jgi:hypothetical protein
MPKYLKLYEEFTESKNYKIRQFFDRLISDINSWFTDGSLAAQESTLIEIEKNIQESGMTRTLKFDFEDKDFRYQVIILIDHTMFDGDNLENCYLTVKKYVLDSSEVVGVIEEEGLNISNLTEDYIINKISEIDDNKNAIEETEIDKQNNYQEESPETSTEETPTEETETTEETPEGEF